MAHILDDWVQGEIALRKAALADLYTAYSQLTAAQKLALSEEVNIPQEDIEGWLGDGSQVVPLPVIYQLANSTALGLGISLDTRPAAGGWSRVAGNLWLYTFPLLDLTDVTNADVFVLDADGVTNSAAGDTARTGQGLDGKAGDILAITYTINTACSTASDGTTINAEIGTTNLTGGVLTLVSDNLTASDPLVTVSTLATGNNTFAADDQISIEASSTTAFAEGDGYISLLCDLS